MPRKNKAAQMLGRRGAKARWAKMTPEQRSEYGRMMKRAQDAKRQAEKSGGESAA